MTDQSNKIRWRIVADPTYFSPVFDQRLPARFEKGDIVVFEEEGKAPDEDGDVYVIRDRDSAGGYVRATDLERVPAGYAQPRGPEVDPDLVAKNARRAGIADAAALIGQGRPVHEYIALARYIEGNVLP